ncbi:MAG: hypothetical protein AABZ06_02150 [Bdellovibrionota bacterium]
MSKLELKRAIDALEIKKPMRLLQGTLKFKAPEESFVGGTENLPGSIGSTEPASALMTSRSPILEETGFKTDTVQNEPCQKPTVSEINSVQNVPGRKQTGSKNDPVTPVRNQLPLILHNGVLKPVGHFSAIPNSLLRDPSMFDDPNDFMIYLRMFSLAFGFGKNTCDMGMAELLSFTRLGKNAIRRSLGRLIAQGWIKKVQDYEAGQVPRKWQVFTPWEMGLTSEQTYVYREKQQDVATLAAPSVSTGSKNDPVENRPGSNETQRGSETDLVTGFRMDPYIKKEEINNIKSSLSSLPEKLRTYFADLKPQRKRESEEMAFEEIRRDFTHEDVAKCLDYLKRKGLPGGNPCHSPMAYMATAMTDILAIVKTEEALENARAENAARQKEEQRLDAETKAREQQEWVAKERAFNKTYPDEERQNEIIREICRSKHFPLKGQASRAFAISSWWSRFTTYERQEVM